MLPSVKRLESAFPGHGKAIRQALESARFCRQHPAGAARIAECYHPPSVVDLQLTVINAITEGCGVEYIRHKDDTCRETLGLDYVNHGGSYAITIIFDHNSGRFILGDWGSIVERRSCYE